LTLKGWKGTEHIIKTIYEYVEVIKSKIEKRQTPEFNKAAFSLILMTIRK
jgi:hypothetical protein